MSIHLCILAAEFKVILDRDSSTVLSHSLHCQTRPVGSEFISKLYTIRKFYSVQHSTVHHILTYYTFTLESFSFIDYA